MEYRKIKILVADDHSVVRNGVIKSLSPNFPDAEFGEAANASEILRLIRESVWNLVIPDTSMPGRNGLEVLKEINQAVPERRLLFSVCTPKISSP